MKKYIFSLSLIICGRVFSQVSFQEHTIIDNSEIINGPQSVFTADLNGDGYLDMLSASPVDNEINWYPNFNGTGKFDTKNIISLTADGANHVFSIDIDGDNDMDVLSTSNKDNKVAWYENLDGLGNFSSENIISSNLTGLRSVFASDIDSDGDVDVISASFNDNKLVWYENLDGKGKFGGEKIITTNSDGPVAFHTTDIDIDGDQDVLLTSTRDGKVAWFENLDGKGDFSEEKVIKQYMTSAGSLDSGDLDNDGDIDVVVISSESEQIFWFENLDGKGSFSDKKIVDNTSEITHEARILDLDNDGDLDIMASGYGFIFWFKNIEGKGNFEGPYIVNEYLRSPNRTYPADIDGDGKLDIVAASVLSNFLAWYRNDGVGNFDSAKYAFENANGPYSVDSADLDDDGDLDILATGAGESKIYWYENLDGQLSLSDQKLVTTSSRGNNARTLDIDGDGDLDILSYNLNPSYDIVEWYENIDGKGNFSETPKVLDNIGDYANANYSFGRSLEPADVDNDGDLDLLSTHYSFAAYTFDHIEWLENLDGKGNFGEKNIISARTDDRNDDGARRLFPADIDGDGDVDIFCSLNVEDRIAWYENIDGKGSFGPQKSIAEDQEDALAIRSADMDGDGDYDVLFTTEFGDRVSICENLDGKGNFSEPATLFFTDGYRSIRHINLDDIDGDLDLDILMVGYNGTVSWIENLGNNQFSSEIILTTTANMAIFSSIEDLDGDDDKDIIISTLGNEIIWFENLGKSENLISGKMLFDLDDNGCDSSDFPLENTMVTVENSTNSFSTFTDVTGNYTIIPNNGLFDITTELVSKTHLKVNPASQEIDFTSESGMTDEVNFCVQANGVFNDLSCNMYPIIPARPGFEATYGVKIENLSNKESNGIIELKFDSSKLKFTNSSEESSLTDGMLKINYTFLKPFQSKIIFIEFKAFEPPLVNIDEVLNFTAEIIPESRDNEPDNNAFTFDQVVIDSFDPNDIRVLEGEEITINQSTDYLNYVIRFQNTGTASAINVKIKHNLDDKLDWTTFKPLSSSHSERITIKDGKHVEFNFEDINLPDSTSNEKESHGFVAFKIKPKMEVSIGDIIKAQAGIYFDFNLPVITNEVTTTIIDETAVDLIIEILDKAEISCNGLSDAEVEIQVTGGVPPYEYQLLDNEDNIVATSEGNIFGDLSAGSYSVRVTDSDSHELSKDFRNFRTRSTYG